MAEGTLEAAKGRLGTVVESATRALGAQAEAQELGVEVKDLTVEVATDSSAAKSFASRRGLGKNRHVEVKWLWLQQAVAQGRVKLQKVPGDVNPADVCTKYQSLREMKVKLARVNIVVEEAAPREARGKAKTEGMDDDFEYGTENFEHSAEVVECRKKSVKEGRGQLAQRGVAEVRDVWGELLGGRDRLQGRAGRGRRWADAAEAV